MTKSSTVDHLEHCDLLEEEIDRFAALVDTAPLSAPVPSCPGWNVGDLVLHLGTVHRWAERLVSVRAPGRIASSDMALDEGPLSGEWMRSGGESLLATLRSADPDAEMWAWGRDQHVRFWSRRELHETLVHRFDLELALGAVPSTAGRVAADTVDEFLDNLAAAEYFSPNVARLRGKGEQISFVATDTGDAWNVVLRPDRFDVSAVDASAAASLSGEAATLALVLYRRLPLPESGLVLDGQHDLVEFWIANSALE
jgi:uncharacterized protein (TIGR03083 family)